MVINGAGISFDAGDMDDNIEVEAAYNIKAGDGDDNVKNIGTVISAIEGGVGNDYVQNDGSAGSINGGVGNDNLVDNYGGTTIFGDVGDDYIVLNGDSSEVYGGDGKDTIFLNGYNNISDAGNGDDMTYMTGSNNIATGGTDGYDKVSNKGINSTYSGMNELMDKSVQMNIQTDYKFTDTSVQGIEIGMNFQGIKLDVSSKDSAASTLAQLDEMILNLTSSRVDLAFQSEMLNNSLEYNLARITNLKDSKASLIDADTALEYNNLIARATMIEQAQLLQAQLQQTQANTLLNLIRSIAG